jgi:hypothetical protein
MGQVRLLVFPEDALYCKRASLSLGLAHAYERFGGGNLTLRIGYKSTSRSKKKFLNIGGPYKSHARFHGRFFQLMTRLFVTANQNDHQFKYFDAGIFPVAVLGFQYLVNRIVVSQSLRNL